MAWGTVGRRGRGGTCGLQGSAPSAGTPDAVKRGTFAGQDRSTSKWRLAQALGSEQPMIYGVTWERKF